MKDSRRLHGILMVLLAIVVVWSLIGVSVHKAGEHTEVSFFIKIQPSAQLFYYE